MTRLGLLACISLFAAQNACAFTLSDFQTPESVIVDVSTGAYYVSNVNGEPLERDGNGYISKINASGSTVIQKFIGGQKENPVLNAPKGLALIGNVLYVTDIDTVKGFDKETGEQVVSMDFSVYEAKFLNDLTADSKAFLYVSDMTANRIYKIDPKTQAVEILKEGPELGNPNGLAINPKTRNLMIVTWASGQVLELASDGTLQIIKESMMALDGIDFDADGNLYVSSFQKGEIYKISDYGRGPLTTFATGLTTPADISCDRKNGVLLIPSFNGNTVSTYPVKK